MSGPDAGVDAQRKAGVIDALVDHLDPVDAQTVRRAWDFAEALYGSARLSSGEEMVSHALGIARILDAVRADAAARAAGLLFAAAERLAKPEEQLKENFGDEIATIAIGVRQLARLGNAARPGRGISATTAAADPRANDPKLVERQAETLRKMLLAFSTDIRVVLVRLASRLQTLRWYAEVKTPLAEWADPGIARESLELYASLANRLGVWQIKWEIEDLAFRFLDPDAYKRAARMLDEKRVERESFILRKTRELHALLLAAGVESVVTGRPKHLYSIVGKMQAKKLSFENLYDVRALRVIVADEAACYAALGVVHGRWHALPTEFDDYIAKPKENGYRSIHTVLNDEEGRPFEVQIRTREMHRFAEYGVAAHWRYKEGGAAAFRSAKTADKFDQRIAWLRQLFAWRSEIAGDLQRDAHDDGAPRHAGEAPSDDRIYVLTPEARVIELPLGATPIDFAYHVHSELGHRCRGARVDGVMVALNTPLLTGQTIEIVTAKPSPTTPLDQLGPSRDWLNVHLGFLQSPRARAKVRQWFNARELEATLAAGRALIEKALQQTARVSGKAMPGFDAVAAKLGFTRADELFAAAAKDEVSLRQVIEAITAGAEGAMPGRDGDDALRARLGAGASVNGDGRGGVLVVGVDALMTQLAKCCKPAPPDPIEGFVTRGRGVAIHRVDCTNLAAMRARDPERMIAVGWGDAGDRSDAVYPVDVQVTAQDRQGLLRDISEVFSREKINVVGVLTESRKGMARMGFTAEVGDARQLQKALTAIAEVPGVVEARRR